MQRLQLSERAFHRIRKRVYHRIGFRECCRLGGYEWTGVTEQRREPAVPEEKGVLNG
jgi:hypothetical protein